ncbi:hypothetical protein [Rothia sp. (in: high G+C Gram-positive bacteria)]|uniref:hypothetical protein n=1 Tax=Rothia sp. (in: high G+C Gram-positive bacteria) TaxID=1885016 RepID=UPI001CAB10D6|nr:hypothetical protein [Rothia sp. (in: high G+C Gram-positive bacteria)]MBF1668664.1 hypothetical protein [Rothia sp. (in: high G+C Gram-positive bacteria)]
MKLSLSLPPVTASKLVHAFGGLGMRGELYDGWKVYCLAHRPALYVKGEPELLSEAGLRFTVGDGAYEATVNLVHQEYAGWHIVCSPLQGGIAGQRPAVEVTFGPHTHVFTPYSLIHAAAPEGWTTWREMVDRELLTYTLLFAEATDNLAGDMRSLPSVVELFDVPAEEVVLFVFDFERDDSALPSPDEVTAELLAPNEGTAAVLCGYSFVA